MAWSGGNFTRANPTWTTDANFGIGIEAGRHDAQDNDFTAGIDQCLNKTGQNSMTGDLNLGGYRPTNVAAGTAAAPALCVANDVNTGIFQAAAAPDTLSIATNSTERVRVDSSGRVGIGITNPSARLDLGTNANGSAFFTTTNGTDANLQLSFATQLAIITNGGGSGSLAFQTGGNFERMRIDSSGRVGIGTTGPSATAHISGQVANAIGTGIDQGQLFISDSDLNTSGLSLGYYYQGGVDEYGRIQARSSAGASNLMLQGGGGSVGIGSVGDSTVRLTTYGTDTGSSNFSFTARSSTTYLFGVRNDGRVGIGTSVPGYQLALSTDSAAKPTTNTWTIASDERIKTNVQPYAKGLAEICQVNPITYDYNGKGGIPAGPGGVSILAQELQPVFPECIGSYKGKLDEGDEEDTDILNYNGHAITFALINAVKELNAKVEALEAKVENLEAVTAGL